MASFTSAGITFDTNSGTKTVVATPTAADLIIVVCANTGQTATPTVTDDNADGHGSYSLITSALKNASADKLFAFVRADPVRSATSTTFSMAPGATTGGGLHVIRVSGMSIVGPAAIRASGVQQNQAASGTPAPAFPQAALTANLVIGAVFNGTNPATMTAPASWTESQDVGYITPTTGLETAFRNSGETGTTITWGSTSGTAFASLILELTIAAGGNFQGAEGEEHSDPRSVQALDRVSVARGSFFMLGEKWARRGRLWLPATVA